LLELQILNDNTLVIKGNIKTVSDAINISNKIKEISARMSDESRILNIKIIDSMSLPSYTIGTLTKIIKVDGIHLYTIVGSEYLFDTLRNLNLLSIFNVRLASTE